MSLKNNVESYFSQDPSPNAQIDEKRKERDTLMKTDKLSASQKKQLAKIESELFAMRREYHEMRALRAEFKSEDNEAVNDDAETSTSSALTVADEHVQVLTKLRDNLNDFLAAVQKQERKPAKRVSRKKSEFAQDADKFVSLAKAILA